MNDFLYVLLTVVVFAVLFLLVKGVERLALVLPERF